MRPVGADVTAYADTADERKAPDWDGLTVGALLALGGDSVGVSCWNCGRTWRAPIVMMPETTSLKKLRSLMRCPTCTSQKVEVWPEWPEDGCNLQ